MSEQKSKKEMMKELMSKKVSTLMGGLIIGGATLLFLLGILLTWVCR